MARSFSNRMMTRCHLVCIWPSPLSSLLLFSPPAHYYHAFFAFLLLSPPFCFSVHHPLPASWPFTSSFFRSSHSGRILGIQMSWNAISSERLSLASAPGTVVSSQHIPPLDFCYSTHYYQIFSSLVCLLIVIMPLGVKSPGMGIFFVSFGATLLTLQYSLVPDFSFYGYLKWWIFISRNKNSPLWVIVQIIKLILF